MILWDSRTIHCNCPSLVASLPSEIPSINLLRVVGYLCMTPTEYVSRSLPLTNIYDMKDSRELLEARVRLYEREIGTSHWPHLLTSFISKTTSVPPRRDFLNEDIERRCLVVGKELAVEEATTQEGDGKGFDIASSL